ncbi:MAG: hypothetical protein ACRDVM_06580, partial [Acidimicrobiia bacterium]
MAEALIVWGIAQIISSSWASYVIGVAAIVALGPLAASLWSSAKTPTPAAQQDRSLDTSAARPPTRAAPHPDHRLFGAVT